jgi:hypothetical protein
MADRERPKLPKLNVHNLGEPASSSSTTTQPAQGTVPQTPPTAGTPQYEVPSPTSSTLQERGHGSPVLLRRSQRQPEQPQSPQSQVFSSSAGHSPNTQALGAQNSASAGQRGPSLENEMAKFTFSEAASNPIVRAHEDGFGKVAATRVAEKRFRALPDRVANAFGRIAVASRFGRDPEATMLPDTQKSVQKNAVAARKASTGEEFTKELEERRTANETKRREIFGNKRTEGKGKEKGKADVSQSSPSRTGSKGKGNGKGGASQE